MRVVQTSYFRLTASPMSSPWVLPAAAAQTSARPEFEAVSIKPDNSRGILAIDHARRAFGN